MTIHKINILINITLMPCKIKTARNKCRRVRPGSQAREDFKNIMPLLRKRKYVVIDNIL